jgi:hypothetical protein
MFPRNDWRNCPGVIGSRAWTRGVGSLGGFGETIGETRDVLGRMGTGAAVAALPLATLLWAASGPGRFAPGLVSAILVAAVLIVTFAPWTAIRRFLPTQKRIEGLEKRWTEGHRLILSSLTRLTLRRLG